MNIIELYIDGKLCDTGKNFGVRLNRQLLNPSELNAKDAQYSYSVTLPPTAANNAIFGYSNIEETKDKFNRLYAAELYVNSVRVFKGNFKLSEISEKQYKGNLYIPASKSIKDIFGDIKLADNPEYRIEFKDFAEYISKYNKAAADGPQMAIFPYALYGVLPKVPLTLDSNNYSARNIWDTSVRMGMQDLAPSINPLLILKHIFDGRKLGSDGKYIGDKPRYKLGGTAFDDERLTRLYMSYKNENDYVQPWNYGYQAVMKLKGSWANIKDNQLEKGGYHTNNNGYEFFSNDIFNSTNTYIDKNALYDPGINVLLNNTQDNNGQIWKQCQIRIPASGFYKIRLKGYLEILQYKNQYWNDPITGITFVGGASDKYNSSLLWRRYELKLLRDRGSGDFLLNNSKIDGTYYRNNLPQNTDFDSSNSLNIPKYFPTQRYNDSGTPNEIMIVDPAQNPNIITGLSWGYDHDKVDCNPLASGRDSEFGKVLAAKTGLSWDIPSNPSSPSKVGIASQGYKKYGKLGDFNEESENPNANIDYSVGNWVINNRLDYNGNLASLPEGYTSIILRRFKLPGNSIYKISIPTNVEYIGSIYLHSSSTSVVPQNIYEFDDNNEIAFTSSSELYLTMYLSYNDNMESGVVFDISYDLAINRTYGGNNAIGWEDTNKFRIDINNSPESYAKSTGPWTAEGEADVIAWLDAGEILTLASTSDDGNCDRNGHHSIWGWTTQKIDFELDITPFSTNEDWLQINSAGNGTGTMNWNDPINFNTDTIDLVKFLPADVKTDDFIENFCKAFNLILHQTAADAFSLDVKQTKAAVSPLYINLDGLASVKDRTNSPLGLPSVYKIGFTVDQEEEGYVMTGDDGGGSFETGAVEESIVEQKSNFSYNWFKEITYTKNGANVKLPLPVISKAEVWANTMAYPDAMRKRYTNLAARFWYFDGLLNDLGADFQFNNNKVSIAKVSNSITGLITLNYKNGVNTILDVYFTVLVNSSSHYTELAGYLTPEQYEQLDGAIMAMFNGDQYYVAELSGYDPLGKNKTKIKLIRKI